MAGSTGLLARVFLAFSNVTDSFTEHDPTGRNSIPGSNENQQAPVFRDPVFTMHKNGNVASKWTTEGAFDEQFSDPFNFGLGENAISIFSAIFIELAIVLVTDLVSRIVVRSRESTTSTFEIYRRWLLSNFSNPITGLKTLSSWAHRHKEVQPFEIDDFEYENSQFENGMPLAHRLSIMILGTIVFVCPVLFIFLATNRSTPAKIQKSSIPSFEFVKSSSSEFVLLDFPSCYGRPVISKPGFTSLSTISICTSRELHNHHEAFVGDLVALVIIWFRSQILFMVATEKLTVVYHQSIEISVPDGISFTSLPRPSTQAKVLDIYSELLRRHGFSVLGHKALNEPGIEKPNWSLVLIANKRNATLPPQIAASMNSSDFEAGLRSSNVSAESVAWNVYLSSIARNGIEPTGRSRAFHINPSGPFLDESQTTLVLKQSPWLSVGGSMILCTAIMTLWVVVVWWFRYGGGVDDRLAWMKLFKNMSSVDDFWKTPEMRIEV